MTLGAAPCLPPWPGTDGSRPAWPTAPAAHTHAPARWSERMRGRCCRKKTERDSTRAICDGDGCNCDGGDYDADDYDGDGCNGDD